VPVIGLIKRRELIACLGRELRIPNPHLDDISLGRWYAFCVRVALNGKSGRRSERFPTRVIEPDVPVVCQHTLLDSRQSENALLSTMAFPEEE